MSTGEKKENKIMNYRLGRTLGSGTFGQVRGINNILNLKWRNTRELMNL
jgi:hypothetical protein